MAACKGVGVEKSENSMRDKAARRELGISAPELRSAYLDHVILSAVSDCRRI